MVENDNPLLLDHVELPIAKLAMARPLLTALGFTLSQVGIHLFDALYLGDGSFMEPLAVRDRAVTGGNVCKVARDPVLRDANGDEGF